MSEIIATTARTPSTIAAEIRTYDQQLKMVGMHCVFEIGRRLVEAKALVAAGEWMDYLQSELGYKQSTANNMMKIYREYNVDGHLPNSQTFGNLDYSKALALLALPAGEREDFVQQNDVDSMSVRQLQATIKERDAALADSNAEKDAANKAARAAEKKAADAQAAEAKLQKEVDRLTAALNKSTAAEEKAKKQIKELKANPKIPEDIKAKLLADAQAQAASTANADLQAQLEEARRQTAEAVKAREAAEREAAEAKEQIAAVQKNTKLANPDVAAINALSSQMADTFNKISGHLMKLEKSDPTLAKRLKELIANFGADVKRRMS